MLNFTVEVRDANRVRVGQLRLEDITVTYTDRYDNVGEWQVTLVPQHPLAPALRAPGAGIIITDIASGETLMSGPVVGIKSTASADDPDGTLTISGASDDVIASDRLAYADPTHADASAATTVEDVRTGPAETLMHQYVAANVGPSAPAGRRIDYLTLGPDAGRGTVQTRRANYQVLGTLLGDIAAPDGLGFRFRQVGTSIEFQTYAVQDRSATVRLDIRNNTLSSHTTEQGPASATRVIVAGKADDDTKPRPTVEVTTDDSRASEAAWRRRIEVFKDARSTADTGELLQQGVSALADAGLAQLAVKAVPMNDTTMVYGRDWGLGDRIAIVVDGVELPGIVTGVVVKAGADGTMMGALIGDPQVIGNGNTGLSSRISNLERNASFGGGPAILSAADFTISTPTSGYPQGDSLLYLTPDLATAGGWANFAGKYGVIRSTTDVTGVVQTFQRLADSANELWMRSGNLSGWTAWTQLAPNDAVTAVSARVGALETEPGTRVQNLGTNAHAEADGIVTYPAGISLMNVGDASGWSLNGGYGLVVTYYQHASRNRQEFYAHATNSIWTRYYSAAWGPWVRAGIDQKLASAKTALSPGTWYRIATIPAGAPKAAAEFIISTDASGQHAYIRLTASFAFASREGAHLSLEEYGGYATGTFSQPFSQARIVPLGAGGANDGAALEVKAGPGLPTAMSMDLAVKHGDWTQSAPQYWQLEDFTAIGATDTEWVNKGLFWTGRWTALTLTGGWAEYGTPYPFGEFRMRPGNVVEVRGMVKNAVTPSTGSYIAVLPEGCRPRLRMIFPVMTNGGAARLDLNSDGGVIWEGGNPAFLSLNGVQFTAEQ